MFLISDLCAILEQYLEKDQVAEIYHAYLFGAEAHEGQRRLSGEPYIYHPLAVARILAEMRLDHKSIAAAILHDVIEDTPTAKEQLSEKFGKEVAELVDGVSKLTNIEFNSKAEMQAENFRKMMLAMVGDIRIILIKLADRLHNMRTLGVMRPDKKRRIAAETLEIYAPIALRLGINKVRLELEELGFQAYYPMRYRALDGAVKKICGNRKEVLKTILNLISSRLEEENLKAEVTGRQKHLYSIYQKMQEKQLPFSELTDVFGYRIIVDSVDSCYRALGVVHNLFKPIPGRFKDYIAIPKANGYQSLHTSLQSRYDFPIEIQIRTEEMNKVAEVGIASHWVYKSGNADENMAQVRARKWLTNLLEIQQQAGDSLEFLENVKVDLFPDEVYVFTPKGEIMPLPQGATAIDFAYAVHTDIGNSTIAVRVNRQLAPLHTILRNGDRIEVLTSSSARPSPAWLNYVITGKARANIRNYLKNLQQGESVELGRRLLNRALIDMNETFETISQERAQQLVDEFGMESLDELYAEIGLGNKMAPLIAYKLLIESDDDQEPKKSKRTKRSKNSLAIKGTEGTVVAYAKCCRPIPGDDIFGFLTSGRGIVIHTQRCNNTQEFQKHPEKWIDVEWGKSIEGEFLVDLRIVVSNRRGVLAVVAATVAEMMSNIDNISLEDKEGSHTTINLTLTVRDRSHLAQIIRRLRQNDGILRIFRDN